MSPSHCTRFTLPRRLLTPAVARVGTLVALAAVGGATLSATTTTPHQRAAAAASTAPAHAVYRAHHRLDRPHPSHVVPARSPAPPSHAPAAARHRSARPATPASRWLPSGTGMWIYEWGRSDHGNARTVVARARGAGLSTLYVRTGSSHDGFTGTRALSALLPATRGTGLHVVAWDFPELVHPRLDADRLARAAWFHHGTGAPVSAVAPDIETPAEGTRTSAAKVAVYLDALRHKLPHDVAILATVPWPSRFRVGQYPYGAVAHGSDALLPMAYWYDNSPVQVTAASIRYLRRFHRPVQPVGQGYDSRLDVPTLPHNNLSWQVPAFFTTAHRMGARAVSLWSWQAAPIAAWRALRRAHHLFRAEH